MKPPYQLSRFRSAVIAAFCSPVADAHKSSSSKSDPTRGHLKSPTGGSRGKAGN